MATPTSLPIHHILIHAWFPSVPISLTNHLSHFPSLHIYHLTTNPFFITLHIPIYVTIPAIHHSFHTFHCMLRHTHDHQRSDTEKDRWWHAKVLLSGVNESSVFCHENSLYSLNKKNKNKKLQGQLVAGQEETFQWQIHVSARQEQLLTITCIYRLEYMWPWLKKDRIKRMYLIKYIVTLLEMVDLK